MLAGRFAEAWGASETAALAALWHDLGKYAAEFQAMITASDPEAHLEGVPGGPGQQMDHSSTRTIRFAAVSVNCSYTRPSDNGNVTNRP